MSRSSARTPSDKARHHSTLHRANSAPGVIWRDEPRDPVHAESESIPRYRAERSWGGQVFSDPHFGSLFGTEQRVLEQRALALLAAAIRTYLPEDAGLQQVQKSPSDLE